MTEAEWEACDDPRQMIASAPESARKQALLGAACCRRWWQVLPGPCLDSITVAEAYADGVVTGRLEDAWAAAREAASLARYEAEEGIGPLGADYLADAVCELVRGRSPLSELACAARAEALEGVDASEADDAGREMLYLAAEDAAEAAERRAQADLVREVFGPLARSESAWTGDVVALALAAYEERHLPSGRLDPARLAVLSDALEEAGCDDAALLAHLRSPGAHVRGCWALDVVLGRG